MLHFYQLTSQLYENKPYVVDIKFSESWENPSMNFLLNLFQKMTVFELFIFKWDTNFEVANRYIIIMSDNEVFDANPIE